jgi:MoaA/NifB/PqqE/SkfB family radical SAM enzyme
MMAMTIMERIDQHTHVPAERLVEAPPYPSSIKIEITSRCNFCCSYCASKRRLRPQGDIDRDFLQRILHEAKSVGVREIGMFLLGESLLVKELPEYVRYAKEQAGIEYVFITTNGSLATPERMTALMDAGLDSIKFSINAGTRERYKEMHGVDAFERVLANLRWLHDFRLKNHFEKPRISVSSIGMGTGFDEVDILRELVKPFVDDFYLLPLYNKGGHVAHGGTGIVGNPGRLENMVPPMPCWTIFNSSRITWNGWLTACSFDHDTSFEIADLNKVSLVEAWHHPKFVELRAKHLSRDCEALKTSVCAKCLGLV